MLVKQCVQTVALLSVLIFCASDLRAQTQQSPQTPQGQTPQTGQQNPSSVAPPTGGSGGGGGGGSTGSGGPGGAGGPGARPNFGEPNATDRQNSALDRLEEDDRRRRSPGMGMSLSSSPRRASPGRASAPGGSNTAPGAQSTTRSRTNEGGTALCRDGTYAFSKNRSGACSTRGGVARWVR
jgi:hypothetical protein